MASISILEHIDYIDNVATTTGPSLNINFPACFRIVVQHFQGIFEAGSSMSALHHFAIDSQSEHSIGDVILIGNWRQFQIISEIHFLFPVEEEL